MDTPKLLMLAAAAGLVLFMLNRPSTKQATATGTIEKFYGMADRTTRNIETIKPPTSTMIEVDAAIPLTAYNPPRIDTRRSEANDTFM